MKTLVKISEDPPRLIHQIDVDAAIYAALKIGRLSFLVRKDEFAFQAGDYVTARYAAPPFPPGEWPSVPAAHQSPPGSLPPEPIRIKPLDFRIVFVMRGGQYGIEPGYVAFSVEPVII